MSRSSLLVILLAALPLAAAAAPDLAWGATGLCRTGQDDAAARPAPAALLPRLEQTFGVAPDVLRGTSYVRCAGGRLMGCTTGANLNCGSANVSRRSEGADAFCHDNPGSDMVPMAATGHDTVYDWHCDGTRAVAGKPTEAVDRLGFMSRNWRLVR